MEKTVSELEQPIVDLEVDQSAVDKNTTTKYGRGRRACACTCADAGKAALLLCRV